MLFVFFWVNFAMVFPLLSCWKLLHCKDRTSLILNPHKQAKRKARFNLSILNGVSANFLTSSNTRNVHLGSARCGLSPFSNLSTGLNGIISSLSALLSNKFNLLKQFHCVPCANVRSLSFTALVDTLAAFRYSVNPARNFRSISLKVIFSPLYFER